MHVDNLCSELYSFPITLSQKQFQSIFRARELPLLFFVYLVPAFIAIWLLETDQYVFPVGQLNEQDRFFPSPIKNSKAIRYARRHSRKHRKERQDFLLQMNCVWKAAHVMSLGIYIYIYGLNDDRHDTTIKADSEPIHQKGGAVTDSKAQSPMGRRSHQWRREVPNRYPESPTVACRASTRFLSLFVLAAFW